MARRDQAAEPKCFFLARSPWRRLRFTSRQEAQTAAANG
jgi:hypothetical protein